MHLTALIEGRHKSALVWPSVCDFLPSIPALHILSTGFLEHHLSGSLWRSHVLTLSRSRFRGTAASQKAGGQHT